jgi:hypothetical protein
VLVELLDELLDELLVEVPGAGVLAAGAGSGPSRDAPLTGGRSGPDPCAAACPLPKPSTPTEIATRSRPNGGRRTPVPPGRRSR